MDDKNFNIAYIIDMVTNYLAGHQLLYETNENVWIVETDGD